MQNRIVQSCTSICFNSRLKDDRRLSSELVTVDQQFRKYDIVIFGASGALGECVVQELALTLSKSSLVSKPTPERSDYTIHEEDEDSGRDTPTASITNSINNHIDGSGGFKWAVAGRSALRLNETLARCEMATGIADLTKSVPIILVDLEQHESLLAVCSQTRLIINCTGPSSAFGELFIKACVDRRTHYVDVSCETSFLEYAQLAYGERAKAAGVVLVPGCGFATMCAELGLNYVHKQVDIDAQLTNIDMVLQLASPQSSARRVGSNFITQHLSLTTFNLYNCLISRTFWLSILSERERYTDETKFNRRKLHKLLLNSTSDETTLATYGNEIEVKKEKEENSKEKEKVINEETTEETQQLLPATIKKLNLAKINQTTQSWLTRFSQAGVFVCSSMGLLTNDADLSCMKRSELVRYSQQQQMSHIASKKSRRRRSPVTTRTFISLDTLTNSIMAFMFVLILQVLANFRLGRYLMRTLPNLTSIGLVTPSGRRADRKRINRLAFVQTYIARGRLDNHLDAVRVSASSDPAKERELLVAQCSGPEPMYVANATFVTQAALTLLHELVGTVGQTTNGILTPGIAFADTSIIERLNARNIVFKTLKQYM